MNRSVRYILHTSAAKHKHRYVAAQAAVQDTSSVIVVAVGESSVRYALVSVTCTRDSTSFTH